ncbi:N-acetylmuramoyl-L-alanine amidase [Nocardia otitidiscaviarum]|uniref:N-acetylmuramoyl-L-alanine amidase n=1 Tax=Nocardia otitidiscaviarum TaxID=1823 RepID=UPI001895EE5A|nr:N-acetylmuramoyl-L-alanine amidase [Nocardia otitidiscaviarum]
MKPSIIKAGIRTAVTAAAITTVAGFVPATALAAPDNPAPDSPAISELPQKLAGKTVFLDPGHQGPNHNQNIARPVSDGRGGSKPCQTTGMVTVNGVPEHTINWNVAQLVRTSLEGLGAEVVLSRSDDTGWGGCIDERAAAANQSGADVAVSIHADSAPAELRGFHLIVPELPVPDAKATEVQGGPGLAASQAMRDAYVRAGFPIASYGGNEGLQTRADIAGPALTHVPDVFLEMGNGANPEDARLLESPEGQLRHAVAITTGLAAFLLGLDPGPAEPQQAAVPEPDPQVQAQAPAPAPEVPAYPVQPAQAIEPDPAPGAEQPAVQPGTPDEPRAEGAPVQLQAQPGAHDDATAPQQAVPGDTAGHGIRPISEGVPIPAGTPAVPQAPGAQPNPQVPAAAAKPNPAAPAAPQLPNAKPSPGATAPSTPGADKTKPSESGSLKTLVQTAVQLLGPMAKMLGMNSQETGIASSLVNLAYTLVSTLMSELIAPTN